MKPNQRACILSLVLLLASGTFMTSTAGEVPDGEDWIRRVVGAVSANAKVAIPRQVAQDSHQLYDCQLPPVWYAQVTRAEKGSGYLMWEVTSPPRLAEFALDPAWVVSGSLVISGVPNLQQFPVPGKAHPTVASGCVPTSAANVLAYWGKHGFEHWLGPDGAKEGPRALARRLRAGLPMEELADEGGYTDDGMPLSGARPEDLAKAIRADAAAHGVNAQVKWGRFSPDRVREEVEAKRPVLLSCEVRLPHKPQLSWGHEVTGIGWMKLGEDVFIGVRDNFFPGQNPEITRWLRADYFDSVITVIPRAE